MKQIFTILLTCAALIINAQSVLTFNNDFNSNILSKQIESIHKLEQLNNQKQTNAPFQFLKNYENFMINEDNEPTLSQKREYEIDDQNGLLTFEKNSRLSNYTQELETQFEHYFTYNLEGILTESLYQSYDLTTHEPNIPTKSYYTYDNDNKLILEEIFDVDTVTNSETINSQIIYSYDENNFLIESKTERWNLPNSIWENFSKREIVRDAEGNITLDTRFSVDIFSLEYTVSNQFEISYRPNGQRLETIFRFKDNATQELVDFYAFQYNYIANDELSYITVQLYNNDSQQFENSTISYYEWDTNFTNEDIIAPTFDANYLNYKLLSYDTYHWDENLQEYETWVSSNRQYNYEEVNLLSSNFEEENSLGINIYPNPFIETITIKDIDINKKYDLYIYNSNGQIVFSENNINNKRINLPNLAAGVYYYKVENENGSATGSLIKK